MQMLAGALGVPIVWLMTGEGRGPAALAQTEPGAREGDGGFDAVLAEVRALRRLCGEMEGRLERLEHRLAQAASDISEGEGT